jgi:hypothetical protein
MKTITKTAADLRRELLAERVERGVALLDREMPDWWELDRKASGYFALTTIDLGLLDMGASGWCVFGQLENPGEDCAYVDMARRVFGSEQAAGEAAIEHGVYAIRDVDYSVLTDLWREVIEKRRADA